MSGPSIVIVGAGAAGLSSALELARRGCDAVTVIDSGYVAGGSSTLSAGIFTRQYVDPADIELRQECYLRLSELERDNGLVLRRNGFVRLAHDEAVLASFQKGAEVQRALGIADARALDADELKRLIPDMRCDDLTGGLFSPSDGYLDGQQLCMTYAEQAEAMGVRILSRHGLIRLERGERLRHRLITARGVFECDAVLNAAGAWATAVGEILGAPIPIIAERHQACVLRLARPLPYTLPSVMDYVPGSGDQGLYLRPEGDRQVIAGLHSNDVCDKGVDPDTFYRGVDATFVDDLIPLLADRLPEMTDLGLEGGWSGLYPNSPDERFIIGPVPGADGIFAACGTDGVGVYMSPVVGRLAAEWLLGEVPVVAGGAERFMPGRLMSPSWGPRGANCSSHGIWPTRPPLE